MLYMTKTLISGLLLCSATLLSGCIFFDNGGDPPLSTQDMGAPDTSPPPADLGAPDQDVTPDAGPPPVPDQGIPLDMDPDPVTDQGTADMPPEPCDCETGEICDAMTKSCVAPRCGEQILTACQPNPACTHVQVVCEQGADLVDCDRPELDERVCLAPLQGTATATKARLAMGKGWAAVSDADAEVKLYQKTQKQGWRAFDTLKANMLASDEREVFNFGRSLAISPQGNWLAVGAHMRRPGTTGRSGIVALYRRINTTWRLATVVGDETTRPVFGEFIALAEHEGDLVQLAVSHVSLPANMVNLSEVIVYSYDGMDTFSQVCSLADLQTLDGPLTLVASQNAVYALSGDKQQLMKCEFIDRAASFTRAFSLKGTFNGLTSSEELIGAVSSQAVQVLRSSDVMVEAELFLQPTEVGATQFAPTLAMTHVGAAPHGALTALDMQTMTHQVLAGPLGNKLSPRTFIPLFPLAAAQRFGAQVALSPEGDLAILTSPLDATARGALYFGQIAP